MYHYKCFVGVPSSSSLRAMSIRQLEPMFNQPSVRELLPLGYSPFSYQTPSAISLTNYVHVLLTDHCLQTEVCWLTHALNIFPYTFHVMPVNHSYFPFTRAFAPASIMSGRLLLAESAITAGKTSLSWYFRYNPKCCLFYEDQGAAGV